MSAEDCVYCLVNMEEVAKFLNLISLKYKGPNGRNLAAIKIQSLIRGFLAKKKF